MLYTFKELSKIIIIDGNKSFIKAIGKKALALLELTNMGIQVPDGYCVLADGLQKMLEENKIQELIKKAVDPNLDQNEQESLLADIRSNIEKSRLPEKLYKQLKNTFRNDKSYYAIRSSGSKEDMENASFAGQYETRLNITGLENIVDAIKYCWASMFTFRVMQYTLNKGFTLCDMGMSVIIQKMVRAEKSGVAFTINPLTGLDTHVLIESCYGLGETLVSGEVNPDQYIYDWYNKKLIDKTISDKKIACICDDMPPFTHKVDLDKEKRNSETLNKNELEEVVNSAIKIQAGYGFPVDIEWVFCNGECHIVQSRPITSHNTSGIKGQWTTADLKDGGISASVCSLMMYSLYKMVWDDKMPAYLIKTKLIDNNDNKDVRSEFFYGRMYWHCGAVKDGLKRILGFNEREFDEGLGIAVGYKGDGHVTGYSLSSVLTGIKVMFALEKSFKNRLEYNRNNYDAIAARIDEIDNIDISKMNESEFFKCYEEVILKDYRMVESAYFEHIFDNANVQTTFRESVKNIKGINYINLVIGLQKLAHLKPISELWKISRKIKHNSEAKKYWETTSTKEIMNALESKSTEYFIPELAEYVKKFKYLSTKELDITVPNYGEDPTFVIDTIKQQTLLDDYCDPIKLNESQYLKYLKEKEILLKNAGFLNKSGIEKKLKRMRKFLWWREELRDLSTRMYNQVRRFSLKAGEYMSKSKILNNPDDIFHFRIENLFKIIKGTIEPSEARKLLEKNQIYYNSFRNFENQPDIGFQSNLAIEKNVSENCLVGIPCSSGSVTGKVKLIKDINDSNRIEKGDILITKFTDPAWTPLFSLISGVITETGGVLSHAAVISREYGIPAVLAVKNVLNKVKDGDEITIDGNTGKIYLKPEADK